MPDRPGSLRRPSGRAGLPGSTTRAPASPTPRDRPRAAPSGGTRSWTARARTAARCCTRIARTAIAPSSAHAQSRLVGQRLEQRGGAAEAPVRVGRDLPERLRVYPAARRVVDRLHFRRHAAIIGHTSKLVNIVPTFLSNTLPVLM